MTKSSMLALSNSIGPCTGSSNAVCPAGTLKRIARGAPAASSRARDLGGQAETGAVVLPRLAARLGASRFVAQALGEQ